MKTFKDIADPFLSWLDQHKDPHKEMIADYNESQKPWSVQCGWCEDTFKEGTLEECREHSKDSYPEEMEDEMVISIMCDWCCYVETKL